MKYGTDEEVQSGREVELHLGHAEFEFPVGNPMGCLGSCWVDSSPKVRCDTGHRDRHVGGGEQ